LKKIILFSILVTLILPAVSSATPPRPGGYMSGYVGVSVPKDTTVTGYSGNVYFSEEIEFDPGINIGMTGGYDFGLFRMEGELSYKHGEMSEINGKSANYQFRDVDGDLGAFAMLFNGFFDLHNDSPITPYIGGGIGFATLYISDTDGTDTLDGARVFLYEEDYDSVFAYQVGGGLEIALNPMLSLDLSYRYFATSEATFDDSWIQTTELEFESHNAAIGLRLKF